MPDGPKKDMLDLVLERLNATRTPEERAQHEKLCDTLSSLLRPSAPVQPTNDSKQPLAEQPAPSTNP